LLFEFAHFAGRDYELEFVAEGGVGSEELDEVGFVWL
jgi:hypothetical protein